MLTPILPTMEDLYFYAPPCYGYQKKRSIEGNNIDLLIYDFVSKTYVFWADIFFLVIGQLLPDGKRYIRSKMERAGLEDPMFTLAWNKVDDYHPYSVQFDKVASNTGHGRFLTSRQHISVHLATIPT